MFQLKLRRSAAAAALVSVLALLPADAALAARSPQPPRSKSPVAAAPIPGSLWDLFTGLLRKFGSSINPDGRDAKLTMDSNGNRTISPDGSH